MNGPTCSVPMMWSLGQACVALCERRRATGEDQRARFNWVMLVCDAAIAPEHLAAAYWRAIADGRDATDELVCPDAARAQAVDACAAVAREELRRRRVAA